MPDKLESRIPLEPTWHALRVGLGKPERVSRTGGDHGAGLITGMVVAQEGEFKSSHRGKFDGQSLSEIVRLGNSGRGSLKSHFGHATLSDDGLGKLLGHVRDFRPGRTRNADGEKVRAALGDLHFVKSAHEAPGLGDIATYVMNRADEGSADISSSLVLQEEQIYPSGRNGMPVYNDDNGEPLTPLWMPKQLHASDIVDTGDAVDGLLPPEGLSQLAGLPDGLVRLASRLMTEQFRGCDRPTTRARCLAWLDRWLEWHFGEDDVPELPKPASAVLQELADRLAENRARMKRFKK